MGGLLPVVAAALAATAGMATSREAHAASSGPYEASFVEVNQSTGATLFYWYTPAANGDSSAPTVVWLNGGPGSSSLIGSFSGLGPHVLVDGRLAPRTSHAWSERCNLLVVDQPAGTGYSFARTAAGYVSTMEEVGRDFTLFLSGFFARHPELEKANSPLWITGESYAGKYIPAIATLGILNHGMVEAFRFKGVAIGNGLTEPSDMALTMAESYHALGLIDTAQRDAATALEHRCVDLVAAGEWEQATAARDSFIDFILNASGGGNVEDVRLYHSYNWSFIEEFMNANTTRSLLRIPTDTPPYCVSHCERVYTALSADIMRGYSELLPPLLARGVQVMLYQGHYDLRDGVAATEAWLRGTFNDSNPRLATGLATAQRHVWREAVPPSAMSTQRSGARDADASTVAGYIQTFANLSHVVVVGAGHMVPMDQPGRAQAMIEGLIAGALGGVPLVSR